MVIADTIRNIDWYQLYTFSSLGLAVLLCTVVAVLVAAKQY